MELMNAKGTKDLAPEEKIIRQNLIDDLRNIFELYGFNPLETPIIERYDVLASKYAGGDEILKETFKLKDQGGRELGLRYDLTVPFSRFVGTNPTIKLPFKRYQIGEVFRDGPIKAGRVREFWQCDVDIVGVKQMTADAEYVMIAKDAFRKIGIDVVVKVNNRKILDGIMEYLGIDKYRWVDAILAIDKLEKKSEKDVEAELVEKGIDDLKAEKLIKAISIKGSNSEKIKQLKKLLTKGIGKEGIDEIEELFSYIDQKDVEFSLSLARGLAYYTGTVFEVFAKDKSFGSALAGGGRYDRMIGEFLGGKKEYPAVGISFGIEPITVVLKKSKKQAKTVTKVYVIPIQQFKEGLKIAQSLRKKGINADIDLLGRGVSKNLEYANSFSIPYVLFVGEDEVKQKKVKLRDMISGKEWLLSVEEVVKKVL